MPPGEIIVGLHFEQSGHCALKFESTVAGGIELIRPGIGRCHVNRWGDGSAHSHIWFVARPEGFAQVKGSYAVEWDDILPPVPEAAWRADLHVVATKLANWGGHARM